VTVLQHPAHLVDVERVLGHQHHRRPAGDARPRGDVAGVTAHDLDDHDPVVRLGGRVQPVDGVDADLDRGVEPEGELGGRQVVVDGLRHPDDGDALVGEAGGDPERVLAADGDEGVDAVIRERRPHGVGPAVDLVGVGARRPEDGAAPREGATERLDAEGYHVVLDRPPPPVAQADHLVAVHALALADHGAHDRVETGAVAATGEHRHLHGRDVTEPPAPPRRERGG
jgi:hypothetical protein